MPGLIGKALGAAPGPDFGARADGSKKGIGYFGVLQRPDGQVSSELSIGVNLGGQDLEIPSMVPTLTRSELEHLLNGGEPTPAIVNKAVDFAVQRMRDGKSPFAEEGEQVPLPAPEKTGPLPGRDRGPGMVGARG